MKILVGSKNPVKSDATKEAFSKYFSDIEVLPFGVDSRVSDQPINEETFKGARNRALALKKIDKEKNLGADYFVGIEGGIIEIYSTWLAFGAICIIDKKGRTGFGSSPHFELPPQVTKKLLEGIELGDVMDEMMGESDIKKKQGSIGVFTKGVMDRKSLYVHGLVTALVPFVNEELFFGEEK